LRDVGLKHFKIAIASAFRMNVEFVARACGKI
jgi:hypothetical protein